MKAVNINPSILTRSGFYFDFTSPEASVIVIEDIAHALANTCRFGGHTRDFYSVAQHCVMASYLVPEADRFAALMHDAAEAYVGDIPTPLKQLLPEFKRIEKRIEAAILNRFGLPEVMPVSVKRADLIMLATEQRDLMPPHDDVWEMIRDVEPMKHRIRAWTPALAYECFLSRFRRLAQVEVKKVAA